jgi:hypothetical protein
MPAFTELCMADLRLKPPSLGITQHPPKDFENQILWVTDTAEVSTNYTAGGAVFNAQSFQISDYFTLPSFASLFDQYCIYAVDCNFTFEISNSTVTPGTFGTAIDFDSSSIPTNYGTLENYSSYQAVPVTQGTTLKRFVKPCVTPSVYNNSTAFSGYSVGRQWIDSANTSVPHYGIKYGVHGNSTAFTGRLYTRIVVGFRNKL